MADFRLNVTADTQRAEKDLQRLGKTATDATKSRSLRIDVSELNRNFKDVQRNVKDAGNTIQSFYRVSKNIPGVGDRVREFENLAKGAANVARSAPSSAAALRENAKAGSILANSFEAASGGAGRLVNNLAKAGFALFAIKEAVGVVKGAFGGFFNETIGREIKLRETILKTQTTLASTNKVFRNGTEITDPYEKIVALTGEVQKRIDSIRERSIALAGVTSNEVIEVFGIVASQIGQIGGGLKEAEDLAINFSAALGTFGIPLYQARQEIGSILRGDITTDSYLAKALGITNEEVARAKTQAGGVVKFLEERLAASVAGQRIAAQGFSGVVSNIRDLGELISQRFGAGLLDPLLGGLTRVFDFLFKIREEVFAISEGIGRGLGSLLSTNLSIISGGSGLFGQLGAGAESFGAQLAEGVQKGFASLQASANTVIAPLRNLFEEIAKSIGLVGAGLARLAQGFLSIQIENFKALVQILSNLSEAVTTFSAGLGKVLQLYGQLLQVPFVQYLSQISAQFQLLERLGVMSAIKLAFAAAGLIAAWQPIVTFFQGLAARIAAIFAGLVAAIGAVFVRLGGIVAAFAATMTSTVPAVEALKQQLLGLSTSLTAAGGSAEKASASIARFGGATTAAARTVGTAILGFIKLNLILLAVQLAITGLIDLYGRFQKAKDEAVSDKRAEQSLKELSTTYKNVGDNASAATKAAKDFHSAVVNARYQKATAEVEALSQKLAELEEDMNRPVKWALDGWFKNWALNRIPEIKKQLEAALKDRDKWAQNNEKSNVQDNIRLEAQNRVNLEKEIGDIRKQQEDQLFQVRQQRAQKEVEIFRAAGELRIYQMEQANKKLIEGEEGASRSALESLNNYLSTRERGELDIEAGKKQLVIEAANLERQISDYRLENEKKIAEIRKRAGEYEQKVSDYRRQLAGQTPVGGVTGLTQGNTGTSSRGDHFHISGAGSEAEARAIFAANINRQLQLTDVPGSARSGGRRHAGYDLAGPVGTPLNLAPGYTLQNFTRDPRGLGGNYATIAGPRGQSYKVMHLADPGSAYKGPGSTGAAPQAPSFADVGAPAVAKYEAAIRSLTSAMGRLAAIQAQLTQAKTKEAFDAIAKSAFEPVGLEQYQDKLYELDGITTALAQNTYDAFNPERTQIAAEGAARVASAQRELGQIIEGINARTNLSEREKDTLIQQVTARHGAFVRSLKDEAQVRLRLNAIQQGVDLSREFQQQVQQITRQNEVLALRKKLLEAGASPEQIEKELRKLEIQQRLDAALKDLNASLKTQEELRTRIAAQIANASPKEAAELKRQLDAANAKIAELQATIAQLQGDADKAKGAVDNQPAEPKDRRNLKDVLRDWNDDLKSMDEEVSKFAETIQSELGTAMSNAVFAVVDGTASVQDAFANMFQNIYQMFVKMVMDMIAKWALLAIFRAFGFTFEGGGVFGEKAAKGASFANGIAAFARGGGFTNSVVYSPTLFRYKDGGSMRAGVMGEAGPEAILPLSRGAGGELGVKLHGDGAGGATNIVVNVDATGSTVQGDNTKGAELGRAISQAVQQELIKQKRPGGILA